MDAWPAPEVPKLPGTGLSPRVYDTSAGEVRPTSPGGTARLYVCGITPYDATHVGHAATYVAFDLLCRIWRDAGHEVHYVQNVTDVDDPLLERARETGADWATLAEQETAVFRADMTELRALPPRHYVGAVEAIPLIVEMIERLRDRGAVYDVNGDLYFPVSTDPRFGGVSGLGPEAMLRAFGENGGDPGRPGKKDPLDCLLWQGAREAEPAWETRLGEGRPGWHIECAAIAHAYLGTGLDVQGGGRDLAFPHHEMGASEAHVATGSWPFARAYIHAGMVRLAGEKMSKSRGNLVFVSDLRRAGHDPMALRLALLAHHYRDDWDWTAEGLAAAGPRLARWRAAVSRPDGPPAEGLLTALRRALADDLNAPAALAAVDRWAEEQRLRGGSDEAAPGLVSRAVDALLGVAL
ncbi:MAG: cysteine--1-D-myo-inosityl 2-amino-2-deoxy-alpha-D-glucopyranoside ligase [Carbonactinosporaceae bacterium]